MSRFRDVAPGFEAFLTTAMQGHDLDRKNNSVNRRFIPRNFLNDERIGSDRVAVYTERLASLDWYSAKSFGDWYAMHQSYLKSHVRLHPPALSDPGDYLEVDLDDPRQCPETFRSPSALVSFKDTDRQTTFVRVVSVSKINHLSGLGMEDKEIYSLAHQYLFEDPKPKESQARLEHLLEEAYLGPRCLHQPIFAAFYEDLKDYLSDPADTRDWPNALRDRLGLYHFNHWAHPRHQYVFLFQYGLEDIPCQKGHPENKPLAVPTVLDQAFSEAFCPPPQNLAHGRVVSLEDFQQEPVREVLHLFMPMKLKHLFRIGRITKPVPEDLGPARRDHLLYLRMMAERDDYAATTDSDLFAR